MKQLQDSYPSPPQVLEIFRKVPHDEQLGFIRLWLAEGIPFAFRSYPAIYEAVRAWLALRLDIHAKEVTLIGSARIGFSLAPAPAFGTPYGANSDLDFAVVSNPYFEQLRTTYTAWESDFQNDTVHPRTAYERSLWNANMAVVPQAVANGYIDPGKIPTWNRYPTAQRFAQTMYSLHKKFSLTAAWPAVSRASIRVYASWDSLIGRVASNMRSAASSSAA